MPRFSCATVSVATAAAIALTAGCSTTADPTTAASTSSAATSSATAKKQAWVRGTHVTLTNGSGAAVQYSAAPGRNGNAPSSNYATLADGKSVSDTGGWSAVASTDIVYRVVYPDGKVAEFDIFNPSIGPPSVDYREGPSTYTFDNSPYKEFSLSENESHTITVAGHTIEFVQGSQDDDNKNWTVTLK